MLNFRNTVIKEEKNAITLVSQREIHRGNTSVIVNEMVVFNRNEPMIGKTILKKKNRTRSRGERLFNVQKQQPLRPLMSIKLNSFPPYLPMKPVKEREFADSFLFNNWTLPSPRASGEAFCSTPIRNPRVEGQMRESLVCYRVRLTPMSHQQCPGRSTQQEWLRDVRCQPELPFRPALPPLTYPNRCEPPLPPFQRPRRFLQNVVPPENDWPNPLRRRPHLNKPRNTRARFSNDFRVFVYKENWEPFTDAQQQTIRDHLRMKMTRCRLSPFHMNMRTTKGRIGLCIRCDNELTQSLILDNKFPSIGNVRLFSTKRECPYDPHSPYIQFFAPDFFGDARPIVDMLKAANQNSNLTMENWFVILYKQCVGGAFIKICVNKDDALHIRNVLRGILTFDLSQVKVLVLNLK